MLPFFQERLTESSRRAVLKTGRYEKLQEFGVWLGLKRQPSVFAP